MPTVIKVTISYSLVVIFTYTVCVQWTYMALLLNNDCLTAVARIFFKKPDFSVSVTFSNLVLLLCAHAKVLLYVIVVVLERG